MYALENKSEAKEIPLKQSMELVNKYQGNARECILSTQKMSNVKGRPG